MQMHFFMLPNNIYSILPIKINLKDIITASRGKKEDVHSKDVEKNNGLPANEPVKVGIQTPAKKNARGASNSSTER